MSKDTEQLFTFGEESEEAQENILESGAGAGEQVEEAAVLHSTGEVADNAGIDGVDLENAVLAATEADGAMEKETSIEVEVITATAQEEKTAQLLKSTSEVEAGKEKEIEEAAVEANRPRENESTIAWLERLESEAWAADEKVKQTAAALKSARDVEAEAKRQAAHTRKRLKAANQQIRETLDVKYQAECTAEQVVASLQFHRIEAARAAAEQAVKEARERARYEAEELKWKSKKAEQEARFRTKWEAETGELGEEISTTPNRVGDVKAETKREEAQIKERLNQAIMQAKRDAQEALDRAKSEATAAGQELGTEAKERIERLHVAILRAIENRNEIKIEADAADDRAIKKAEALKIAREAYEEAKLEAAEARARLREAMSVAKNETKEARDRAKRKAREATMVASGNEISGYVRLQIARPVSHGPVREFELALAQSSSFRVESVGGTADEGAYIDVSIDEPVHLLSILSEMPHIESFWKNDKGIKVELSTAAVK